MDPIVITIATAVGTGLTGAVGFLWREMIKVQKAEVECRERLAQVTAEVWNLNARLEMTSWLGDDSPNGLIVIDADGAVVEWSPSTTIMLHWTAREMIGKPILRIIPEPYRQQHTEALARLRQSNAAPRRGPFSFEAVSKEGVKIACEVCLSGWSVGGQRYYAAALRPRFREPLGIPVVASEVKV